MFRRIIAIAVAAVLAITVTTAPVLAQATSPIPKPVPAAVGGTPAAGFSIPINADSAGQGSFTGVLRITRFATENNKLYAIGLLTGTLQDEAGGLSSIVKNVALPATLPSALNKKPGGAATAATCDVLNLVLGPLDLNLLGLEVHLNQVVLDLVAVTGAGNLLGNLLCAITNLFNGLGTLVDIVNLLNQLLSLLGG